MKTHHLIAVAQDLGRKAFENRLKRQHSLDLNLLELCTGKEKKLELKLQSNWYVGWDLANLRSS